MILLCLSSWMLAQDTECSRKALYGTTEICLPLIKGYQECYTKPSVKEFADFTEGEENQVVGFYLNNQTYAKKDNLEHDDFEKYCKIASLKGMEGYDIDINMLKQMQEMMSGNSLAKNWETVQKEIESMDLEHEVEMGVPTVVDEYKLTDNSFTFLMISTYQKEGEEPYSMAVAANGLLIHDRLFWVTYYLNYIGEKTMSKLRKNSDEILTQLLRANE